MNYSNQNEYYNYNEEIYQEKQDDVKEEIEVNIRLGFIRKVYGILTVQLLFTSLFTLWCMMSDSLKIFSVPINYILLGIFTLLESYIVGFICSFSNPKYVFMAACMTFIITAFLTLYAIMTKTDITKKGAILFILSGALLSFVIFNFFFRIKILHVIICCFGIIIVGFYIVYDTQIIIGKKKEVISVDDYILGSFLLYTDIISLFLYILSLFNSSD